MRVEIVQRLLEVVGLKKYFKSPGILFGSKNVVHAVDGVDFYIDEGETLGLVGESGCGKSTIGFSIMRLVEPTAGKVYLQGKDVLSLEKEEIRKIRHKMQMIFQDPYASLNPRKTVGQIIGRPLEIHKIATGSDLKKRVLELLDMVGLEHEHVDRHPHEFSGGQRQRIGIARALAVNPDLIVADEPVSALDVSIQAQILNVMRDLQRRLRLSYLFISHELSVVRHISDRIAVMYLGKIIETAQKRDLVESPQHPYTQALLSAAPVPNPRKTRERTRIILKGEVPSPIKPPPGCRFHTRCFLRMPKCSVEKPQPVDIGRGHIVYCHAVGG